LLVLEASRIENLKMTGKLDRKMTEKLDEKMTVKWRCCNRLQHLLIAGKKGRKIAEMNNRQDNLV